MFETTRLLCDLVSLPSVNPMGRSLQGPHLYEHRVTAYLEQFFRGLVVPYERQPVAPQRDNIIARCDLPGATRTLMWEVHQDTVPTDNMTIEPFVPTIEDGRLYGRGACDIKGGMAAMLAAFAELARKRPSAEFNIVLACTVDEEHTFTGVQKLVEDGVNVDWAIVAEPTRLQIVNAHKGVVRWYLTTPGRACHSSSPEQGINAIYRMARVLTVVEQYAAELQASGSDPALGPPTLSIGVIEGGTSVNTVPDRCRIEVDRRLITGEDPMAAPDQLNGFLKERLGDDVPFECSEAWMFAPALDPAGSAELVQRLGEAINAIVGRHSVHAVPYGTDASSIAEAGVPAIVFGPGDVAQAHTRDEWVSLEQVHQANEILYRMACGE